jgi:hypothetical protein
VKTTDCRAALRFARNDGVMRAIAVRTTDCHAALISARNDGVTRAIVVSSTGCHAALRFARNDKKTLSEFETLKGLLFGTRAFIYSFTK